MRFLLVAALVVLSSCNLKLEPNVNPDLKIDPNIVTNFANDLLTNKSRAEGMAGKKTMSFNIGWSQSVLKELGINDQKNCSQLVYLSNNDLVVDVAAVACPANDALFDPNSVLFTLDWVDVKDGEARLYFNNRPAGTVYYDWGFPTAQLENLCSGTYKSSCLLTIVSGIIKSIK